MVMIRALDGTIRADGRPMAMFKNCNGDDDIDAKRSRPSIGKPDIGHAKKERVFLFGTNQRITSGPAAKRLHSKAGYMAAPERFADWSDFSCTAGAVHTWPMTSLAAAQQFVGVGHSYFPRLLSESEPATSILWASLSASRRGIVFVDALVPDRGTPHHSGMMMNPSYCSTIKNRGIRIAVLDLSAAADQLLAQHRAVPAEHRLGSGELRLAGPLFSGLDRSGHFRRAHAAVQRRRRDSPPDKIGQNRG
jgi:hypothetical protein